jgi:hypothetical protein
MALKDNAKCLPIARTGRVQDWIDDPDGRLPVSCTVFVVQDSMKGEDGIEGSWAFVSHALRNGAGAAIHLSKLRPRGTDNGKGLVSSGPVSFGMIYSKLNEVLRRGGKFKNGAVVLHLDYEHPDAMEFISAPRKDFQWAKRCVNVDNNFIEKSSPEFITALTKAITQGDVWLMKMRFDDEGNRIHGNVCLEVLLPHRGTCLLQHVNVGALQYNDDNDWADTYKAGMKELCELHGRTGVEKGGHYLPPVIDRQVGLGILGLANCLAINGITYAELADALDAWFEADDASATNPGFKDWSSLSHTKAATLVVNWNHALEQAAEIAESYNMDRAFAIAPTASCAYRYLDAQGFTTTPELAPPIARLIDRDSSTFGVESFDHGSVEIASEVGWEVYKRVANGIVRMYEDTGLFHGYSYNWWSDMTKCDEAFLKDWLESPQTSLYYALPVMPNAQAKDDAFVALDDDFKELFGLDEEQKLEQQCTSCSE